MAGWSACSIWSWNAWPGAGTASALTSEPRASVWADCWSLELTLVLPHEMSEAAPPMSAGRSANRAAADPGCGAPEPDAVAPTGTGQAPPVCSRDGSPCHLADEAANPVLDRIQRRH